jgi:anti-sigma B factor antagonist
LYARVLGAPVDEASRAEQRHSPSRLKEPEMGEVPQPLLRVEHQRSADAHVINLLGEMDLSNVDEARKAVMTAIEGDVVAVIVDLSELEFIDSIGISMLLEAQAASRRDSNRLGFRGAQAEIAKVMELTGVDRQLNFID